MKTYGQVDYEARLDWEAKNEPFAIYLGTQPDPKRAWHLVIEQTRAMSETGAQAVIEEFKRRHNIVIPPEED